MGTDDTTKELTNGHLARILDELAAIRSELGEVRNDQKALEDKVDARLRDTRPVWEAVQAQLKEIRGDIETGFRDLRRQIGVLSRDIVEVRADSRGF